MSRCLQRQLTPNDLINDFFIELCNNCQNLSQPFITCSSLISYKILFNFFSETFFCINFEQQIILLLPLTSLPSSVTRFGKISPKRQYFKNLWQLLSVNLVFSTCLNLFDNFYASTYWANFIRVNGQILNR